MFHQSTDFESSHKEKSPSIHTRTFIWVLAMTLGLVLVFSVASSPALAATGEVRLEVAPQNVGIPGDGINCDGVLPNGTSVCHVTLTETVSSSRPLHWFTR